MEYTLVTAFYLAGPCPKDLHSKMSSELNCRAVSYFSEQKYTYFFPTVKAVHTHWEKNFKHRNMQSTNESPHNLTPDVALYSSIQIF